MRVAHFVHRYPPALGGAEAYSARLCEYLAVCGDTVSVWTTTALELSEFWREGGARPPSLAAGTTGRTGGFSTLSVRRFAPLHLPLRRYVLKALSLVPVRQWQCLCMPCNPVCPGMWHAANRHSGPLDVVHATAFPYSFPILCGLRLAQRHGVPFFLTPFLHLGDVADPHDRTRWQYTAPHLRWLLQQADGVFVQTLQELDAVVALGVPAGRVHLQGLGIVPGECTGGDRQTTRKEWGLQADECVIGHLSNNSIEKGTVDLLRAAAIAWSRGQRFRVVLAGPQMPNFQRFWERYPAKHDVVQLGVLSEQQKRDFFAGIDVMALPSRCDSFGLVLLEAWANRKPNLVYRAGGPAELVRDGVDGLHARCGDVGELADQLCRLVKNLPLRQVLGERGWSRIDHEFRWKDKLQLVRRVLASGSPSGRGREPTAKLASEHSPGVTLF